MGESEGKLMEGGLTLEILRNLLRQGANLTLDNPGEQGMYVIQDMKGCGLWGVVSWAFKKVCFWIY